MGEQCEGCERDLRVDEWHETEDMVTLCDDCWQECVDDPTCHDDECDCAKCNLSCHADVLLEIANG